MQISVDRAEVALEDQLERIRLAQRARHAIRVRQNRLHHLTVPEADHRVSQAAATVVAQDASGDIPEHWPTQSTAGSAVPDFDRCRSATAYSTRAIVDGDRPILLVIHSEDETWQFLPGDEVTQAEGVALHLGHIIEEHPDLAILADLLPGWGAERESIASSWERLPWPEDDEDEDEDED
jgi:hypothetical protein